MKLFALELRRLGRAASLGQGLRQGRDDRVPRRPAGAVGRGVGAAGRALRGDAGRLPDSGGGGPVPGTCAEEQHGAGVLPGGAIGLPQSLPSWLGISAFHMPLYCPFDGA